MWPRAIGSVDTSWEAFLYANVMLVVGALVRLIVAWLGRLTRKIEKED